MVPFSEKDLVAVNEKVQLEALKGFYARWEEIVDIFFEEKPVTCSTLYPTRDELQRLQIPNSYFRAEEMRKVKEKSLLRCQR